MRRTAVLASLAFLLLPIAAVKADPAVTNPIRYTWIATACETWNCAASALVLANGDKYVIAMPTGDKQHPWVILRRVEDGSIYIPESEPFACETFDNLASAHSKMTGTDSCHAPMILSVPDGRTVVTSLTTCKASKQRAVR